MGAPGARPKYSRELRRLGVIEGVGYVLMFALAMALVGVVW